MGTGSVQHLSLQCSLRELLAVCLIEVMGTGSIHHLGLFTQGPTCCVSDSGHGDRVCSSSGSVCSSVLHAVCLFQPTLILCSVL